MSPKARTLSSASVSASASSTFPETDSSELILLPEARFQKARPGTSGSPTRRSRRGHSIIARAITALLLAAITLLSLPVSANTGFSLNDVSILLPVPTNKQDFQAHYFNGNTSLGSKPLLPQEHMKLFKWGNAISRQNLSRSENFQRLGVLGIRLDPCFKEQFAENCRPQIRLVLQPIVFEGFNQPKADDAGIHLFFDTTRERVIGLIEKLQQYRVARLGEGSKDSPLQVHPILYHERMDGAYWTLLRQSLTEILNEAALTRVAFFILENGGAKWDFRSIDFIAGKAVPVAVGGMAKSTTFQILESRTVPTDKVEFVTLSDRLPKQTPGTDQLFEFLNDSKSFHSSASGAKRVELMRSLERIENPETHLPGTIDCVSCHATPAIKTNLRRHGTVSFDFPESFVSRTLPASATKALYAENSKNLDFRLFGFRGVIPLVGERVIQESAHIVDELNLSR